MAKTVCTFCKNDADVELVLDGKPVCRVCAHNGSHAFPLRANEIPCPVVEGGTGKVIPYGVYPNLDMT